MKNQSIRLAALLLLILFSGMMLTAQAERALDDRELFIRPQIANDVRPNVMLLADNSGSMNTAIYHPHYNPTTDYMTGYTLTGLSASEHSPQPSDWFTSSGTRLDEIINFKICRGGVTLETRTATATYISRSGRTWTVEMYPGSPPFRAGDDIRFYYYNRGWVYYEILSVTSLGGDLVSIEVGTNRYPNRAYLGGAYARVSSTYQVPVPNQNTANFIPSNQTCLSGQEYSITLFGDSDHGNDTRYDLNYLYWLAFFATPQELSEVRTWANHPVGVFPNAQGTPVDVGHYRIEVLRRVLKDVSAEVYQIVNLGITNFRSNSAGGIVTEPMSNVSNLNAFHVAIDNIEADTWTPLAEAMADVWYYFKGGLANDYRPNDETTSNCGTATGGDFPTSCPIQYYCQRNYVIVMTDGQSTKDQFGDTFPGDNKWGGPGNCIFQRPISQWGDLDNHDPSSYGQTQPNITDYCEMETCWIRGDEGTDYLDDVAYYLRMNDMFPDANYPDMPGMQNLITYTIGFTIHNMLLAETAANGDGVYYTATDYESLKNALKNAIYDILIREFAFASFTAPKKVTSTIGEGFSYVGYFKPSNAEAVWDGYLQSFQVRETWCRDSNNNNQLDGNECATEYDTEMDCEDQSGGVQCLATIDFSDTPDWRAEDKIKQIAGSRNVFTTIDNSQTVHYLNDPSIFATLRDTIWGVATDAEANTIINKVSDKKLADIFHSDITFVGPPPEGKKFLLNYNPTECSPGSPGDPDCFVNFYEANKNRRKAVYVGTNDGAIHQIDAVSGEEQWALIPDEALPALKSIVIDGKYQFTMDGRCLVEDVYCRAGGVTGWRTLLFTGMRDGGNAFYALDVTDPEANPPVVRWKFKNAVYSGRSWSKPLVGKVKTGSIDRWVVVLAGGMDFNYADPDELKGKAVFVLDAATGEPIWTVAYKGSTNPISGAVMEDQTIPEFNYPVPSSITVIDRDNNGYLDTIYFGNTAGHLFKTDISSSDIGDWHTFLLFKSTPAAETQVRIASTVSSVSEMRLSANVDETGVNGWRDYTIMGMSSHALAVVNTTDQRDITFQLMSAQNFQAGEQVVRIKNSFNSIFLAPVVAYDKCYNTWVCFGTGDRVRPRSNPTSGSFYAIKDTILNSIQITDLIETDLKQLTWSSGQISGDNTVNLQLFSGFFFRYPSEANYEKLFDPDPLILPDDFGSPHVYFNTYQPPTSGVSGGSDPCMVQAGTMMFFDICIDLCAAGGTVTGTTEVGRIAGGGMFSGSEYILYEGRGEVGSIPPLQAVRRKDFRNIQGTIFVREKKR